MTSYFKAFGLALLAAFAFSALAASGASAVNHHFDGTKGDALSAEAENHQVFESTTGEEKGYICGEVGVNGEVEAATQASVTVEPEYSECQAFEKTPKTDINNTPVFVITNGCHFKFTGETTTGNLTENGEHANVDIICPEGESIEIRATAAKLKCSDIGEQEVKHAVRYENETTAGDGKTHVTVEATAHGIESTTTNVCGSGNHTNGSYTGNVTVTAPNGVSITNVK